MPGGLFVKRGGCGVSGRWPESCGRSEREGRGPGGLFVKRGGCGVSGQWAESCGRSERARQRAGMACS